MLNRPIQKPNVLTMGLILNTPDHIRQQVYALVDADLQRQYEERVSALADHYNVSLREDNAARKLLIKLATDFIVGFNDVSRIGNVKAGRRRGQTKGDVYELSWAAKELERTRGLTRLSACTYLSKQRGTPWYGRPPKAMSEQIRRHNQKKPSVDATSAKELFGKIWRIVAPYKKL